MSFSGGIRKGGGFLNDVVIKVTGYQFTNKAPGTGASSEWVNFVLKYIQADTTVEQTHSLFVGGVKDLAISEDGQQVVALDGGPVRIDGKTPFGRFVTTLIAKGFPEASLPDLEAGEPLQMKALVGYRLNLVQEKDERGTAKRGQRKDPKTGKLYDRTNTIVGAVLGQTQVSQQAFAAAQAQVTFGAGEIVAAILAAKGGSLPKAQLQMELFKQLGPQNPIVKALADEKALAALPGISVDTSTPARVVSLATVNAA
jgi:hypothetical protein